MTAQVHTNPAPTRPQNLTTGRLPRLIDLWVGLASIGIGALVFAGFGHIDYVAGWLVVGAIVYQIGRAHV